MTKKQRALEAIRLLAQAYPEARCSLEYGKAYELLIATRLSAQCTDKRVNQITPELFARFDTLQSLAEADVREVEGIIRSCGLYKTKARDIVALSQMMLDTYGGAVPDTIEALVRLPGIGRKTANLIVGDVYGKPAVITDTHVIRISGRIGLTDSSDPLKVEKDLRAVLPEEESTLFCHRMVWHGREICTARKPLCERCALLPCCKFGQIKIKDKN